MVVSVSFLLLSGWDKAVGRWRGGLDEGLWSKRNRNRSYSRVRVFCCVMNKFRPSPSVGTLSARPMWMCHGNLTPSTSFTTSININQHPSQQGHSTSSQSNDTLISRIVSFLIPLLSPSTQSPGGAAPVKLFNRASKVPEEKMTNKSIWVCR